MRTFLITALLVALPQVAFAQALTQKCEGETWDEIARQRYGDPKFGKALAIYNRKADDETCTNGRFVRLMAVIRHEVRLGQTLEAIASRFFRAPGGEMLLRERLALPKGTEPETGKVIEIPVELAIAVGSMPEKDLAAIPGLPSMDEIRKFNGVGAGAPLPKGTVYVPLFVTPKDAPKPPPPPVADGTPPPPPPPPTEDTTKKPGVQAVANAYPARFDQFLHPKHASVTQFVGCAGCHVANPASPHTYKSIDTKTCLTCHPSFVETATIARTQRLALTFSHDLHLNESRTVKQEGYTTGCQRCHGLEDGEQDIIRPTPGHKNCVKCHNKSEAKPTIEADCSGCHATAESQDRLTLARALLAEHYRGGPRQTDIRFTHAAHVPKDADEAMADAACDDCHLEARKSDDLASIEPMRMADCLECHQGMVKEMADRSQRLDRCAVCHVRTRQAVSPFLSSGLERTMAHSPTFARRHEQASLDDDGDCQTCHVELSGGVGAECQRCHERMRPRDHTVRWRDEPHGRASVRDPERCATCHERERCADCHSIAPRDHFPRQSFRVRHGIAAQRSMRRCQTCHLPQVDCARCHDVQVR